MKLDYDIWNDELAGVKPRFDLRKLAKRFGLWSGLALLAWEIRGLLVAGSFVASGAALDAGNALGLGIANAVLRIIA
jgi:hypothetical protein